ncbi:Lipid A biosynthesis lauroyl acyltransferase [hydrothermal vent metagenome]|uniref:Lipid A biosynthesis lauroyl acyltransferase n=1 Tax=hydrothermal vent metagenome TaxID=652676 RepID=A0A1W1CIX6_9ZZZZ
MIKIILKILSFLPLRFNHLLGSFIGWCLWFFNTDVKKISEKNIQQCLNNLDILKQSLIETGKTLFETANIWFEPYHRNLKRIKTTGAEVLDKNKAIIILLPHLGCWEIVGNYLSNQKKITCLYKQLKNKKANQQLVEARESRGYILAPANKLGVIKLQKAILNKEWIGILPDQNPGENNGIKVNFFGKKALTMSLLVKLVRKNNVQVVSTWAERLGRGKGYLIHFKEVNVQANTNKLEDDCLLMNQIIENMILQKPEQYQWSYNRFKY